MLLRIALMMWASLLVGSLVMGQDLTSADAPQDVPTISPEIQADLNDLSAQEFKTREAAAKRLLARKSDAVKPLVHLTESKSPEAARRAFDLLRRLYREGDDATNELVELAFESLSQHENPTVASRAEAAIEAGTAIRHRKAIAEFRKLGGKIRFRPDTEGSEPDPVEDESLRPIDYVLIDKGWTGGDAGLKVLRRIEDYRIQSEVRGANLFVIKGSKISLEALAELEGSLPGLLIQRRGPACLGITPLERFGGDNGLSIYEVKPGTAAHRAGLQQGDVLMKFNGHTFPDFETLVDRISETQPGDKVPVVYIRDGIQTSVTVEMRAWE